MPPLVQPSQQHGAIHANDHALQQSALIFLELLVKPLASLAWTLLTRAIRQQTALESGSLAPSADAIHLTHPESAPHVDCTVLQLGSTAFFLLQSHAILGQHALHFHELAQRLDGPLDSSLHTDLIRL